jgi:hypothetical protein
MLFYFTPVSVFQNKFIGELMSDFFAAALPGLS